MGDVTSDSDIQYIGGVEGGTKKFEVFCPATVDDGDTFTIDLATASATKIEGIFGFIHTTAGSVVAAEAPTTSVSGTTLTVTVGGSTDNKKRYYLIHVR